MRNNSQENTKYLETRLSEKAPNVINVRGHPELGSQSVITLTEIGVMVDNKIIPYNQFYRNSFGNDPEQEKLGRRKIPFSAPCIWKVVVRGTKCGSTYETQWSTEYIENLVNISPINQIIEKAKFLNSLN